MILFAEWPKRKAFRLLAMTKNRLWSSERPPL